MIGGKRQLNAVIVEAIDSIDERYDGYRGDLAKAAIEVISAQMNSATDSGRRNVIQQLVQSLGTKIVNAEGDSTL